MDIGKQSLSLNFSVLQYLIILCDNGNLSSIS